MLIGIANFRYEGKKGVDVDVVRDLVVYGASYRSCDLQLMIAKYFAMIDPKSSNWILYKVRCRSFVLVKYDAEGEIFDEESYRSST